MNIENKDEKPISEENHQQSEEQIENIKDKDKYLKRLNVPPPYYKNTIISYKIKEKIYM